MKKLLIYLLITLWATAVFAQRSTVKIPEQTLDYINRVAEGDHLALEGGHMALDGHVMPYPFFESHEVLYLYRLSQLRHHTIWKADSVWYKEGWDKSFLKQDGRKIGKKIPSSELVGGRHTISTYWMKVPKLPESKTGFERFFCLKPMDMSLVGWPETTIYMNGKVKAALLRQHFYWSLNQLQEEGTVEDMQLCLKSFGVFDQPRGYREISIVERNPQIDQLYWYLRVCVEAASIMEPEEHGYKEIRALADKIMASLDLDQAGTVPFQGKLAQLMPQVETAFKDIQAMAVSSPTLFVMMHGHLDSAWRWTFEHTDEKIERLVLNNLYLMDRYPEYRYVFTTPYHYERLAKLYPDLFERVQEKIRNGQWNAKGSTYVENDMNLPGGESIVRQFLYGLQYFSDTLKVKKKALFMPDTFGYPPFLPQIANSFGLDHLVAMRVNTPKIDHSIYRWKGMDGSELLVNGLTTPAWEYPFIGAVHGHRIEKPELITTYNAPDPGPRRARGTWEQFKDADRTDKQLMLIGWGDGGGGGTEDQIELMRYGHQLPSFPKLEWTDMNDYLDKQLANKEAFEVFDQRILARRFIQRTFMMANGIKKHNRAVEQRLREAEVLSVWATKYGKEYPAEQLTDLWKQLLVHHFHDVITGMAVPEVLTEANRTLAELELEVRKLRDEAWSVIQENRTFEQEGILAFNPAGVVREGVVTLPHMDMPKGKFHLVDAEGQEVASAINEKGKLLVQVDTWQPMSFKQLYFKEGASSKAIVPALSASKRTLENTKVKVVFNKYGEIERYYDKVLKREIVPTGKTQNRLLAVAHDTKKGFVPITSEATFTAYEANALQAGFTLRRTYKSSTIEQRIVLNRDSKLLSFETALDWNEKERLEVDFPITSTATIANHGIQWGSMPVTRSSYLETDSLEKPTCVHQWADISENDYGVALIDNTRYAYNLKEGGIRLTLSYGVRKHHFPELKKVAWNKDAAGDTGGEQFSYAIFPHEGNHVRGKVIQTAKAYNTPLIGKKVSKQGGSDMPSELFTGLPSNIILQTVKKSEKGDGWVIRLYETAQRQTTCSLKFLEAPEAQLFSASMGEEQQQKVQQKDKGFGLTFKPFEIKTLVVYPEGLPVK
ncbi:alpha-mannosidase [Algivirga pacifica]|uniref:Alpha-mannosidase n=1 Tax=Algivirga pacifica TaxID=1162670 RepID=A0ABP9D8X0_9BACT